METIFIGGGCFWCIEAPFNLIKGIKSVTPGYMGGDVKNPTYEMVCSGQTGHAEIVKVEYDSDVISLSALMDVFLSIHDPTTINRQGADVGSQYRSIIFVHEDIFDHLTALLKEINNSNKFTSKVVTDVHPLNFDDWQGKSGVVEKTFWPAENYHENYFNKNKNNTYCSVVIAPKINIIENNYPYLIKN